MAQRPHSGLRHLFSLNMQNTKSKGAKWTFSRQSIPPRIKDLPKNHHKKGLDKVSAKTGIMPNSAPPSSREAPKECSPRRKPWDTENPNQQAPEGRKKPPQTPKAGTDKTGWNMHPRRRPARAGVGQGSASAKALGHPKLANDLRSR